MICLLYFTLCLLYDMLSVKIGDLACWTSDSLKRLRTKTKFGKTSQTLILKKPLIHSKSSFIYGRRVKLIPSRRDNDMLN